jgi:D-aspartate ligase
MNVTATAPARPSAARNAGSKNIGAIVVGGDYRGLGVVRSLGRRGIPVWVLAGKDDALARFSRYVRRTVWVAELGSPDLVPKLLELAESNGLEGWALIPTADETAAMLSRDRETLARRFVMTVPAWEVLRWMYDKRLTYELADDVGVDHPWTAYPQNAMDIETLECQFPVILKPAIKPAFNRLTAAKAWRVDGRPELLKRYDEACSLVAPDTLMVQQVVPGGGESQFSFAALCLDGSVLASATARRSRQYPADFGRASTYVETVEAPDVEEPARRLLSAVGYTGLAEIEFKRDSRTGRLLLLDVNPRVWGWHSLCARAGVDFPFLLWQLSRGEELQEVRARPGERWVRLSTDLPTACWEILRGRLSARGYVRSLRGPVEGAIFVRDDPIPGFVEPALLASVAAKRLARGTGL